MENSTIFTIFAIMFVLIFGKVLLTATMHIVATLFGAVMLFISVGGILYGLGWYYGFIGDSEKPEEHKTVYEQAYEEEKVEQQRVVSRAWAADASVPLTMLNYKRLDILDREYLKIQDDPYTYKTEVRMGGNLAVRAVKDFYGTQLYIIRKQDDRAFGTDGYGVLKVELPKSGNEWAVKGCINNTIGCEVDVYVEYIFVTPTDPEIRLNVKRK